MFRKKKKSEKLRLTTDEEFQIFKLVIDKYLWIGTASLVYGVYLLLNPSVDAGYGLLVTLIGALILLMFTAVMFREFDFDRRK